MGSMPVALLQDGELYQIHSNQLAAPEVITDTWGTVVWRWTPKPFGDSLADEDPDGDGQRFTFNLRFPGQYFDAETGLYYNYYRDYDPNTGKYTTSDAIGLEGGINTYAYVGGNPISYTDPTGLFRMCHRDLLLPIPYARHCFIEFQDGTTLSYDPSGVNPDPDPNQVGEICTTPQNPEQDDCLKEAMENCKGDDYNFTQFNCCHCSEQAMKACGVSIDKYDWPNWPVNPGPQIGEPGYSPVPTWDSTLGQ
jgi:RHS repeat-associated protein